MTGIFIFWIVVCVIWTWNIKNTAPSQGVAVPLVNKKVELVDASRLKEFEKIVHPEVGSNEVDKSADIKPLDSASAKEDRSIADLYSKPSNPPRPIQSIYIEEEMSTEALDAFWKESVAEFDHFDASNMPSADSHGRIYLMNYIFMPNDQMVSIFLLTAEYLDRKDGLHAWPSKWRKNVPELYRNIRSTIYPDYPAAAPFACVFRVGGHVWISQVDYVPNNTTRDRYVNEGTEIMRCDVPMGAMQKQYGDDSGLFFDAQHRFEFLLTQKWRHLLPHDHPLYEGGQGDEGGWEVHAALSFVMGQRSGVGLHSMADPFMFSKANQHRFLSLCVPPMSEPLSFISEFVAHYIGNIGIEHIYLGTHFGMVEPEQADKARERLLERVRPWYDGGLITIWPHEQPWIEFTDKAKSHWLNQCLYFAKSRDSHVLSLDVDEFLVLRGIENTFNVFNGHAAEGAGGERAMVVLDEKAFAVRQARMQSVLADMVRSKVAEYDEDHWCWLTFQSHQMWKLLNEEEPFMTRRFIGREEKAQLTWSKVIWNTKHLHFTGYHAGGACSAQQHDWTKVVHDWRDDKDPTYVYRFDPEAEGSLFHYYNNRHVRIEPKDKNCRNPWSDLVIDTVMMDVYWPNIERAFTLNKLDPTYPDPHSDVMTTKYYKQHYGEGQNMLVWHEDLFKE